LGVFSTRISPTKAKYRYEKIDDGYKISQEFVPDEGVVLVPEGDYVSFNAPNGDKFDNFKEEWYGTAKIKNKDGSSLPYCEWIAKNN
jgi:hypothetical protein